MAIGQACLFPLPNKGTFLARGLLGTVESQAHLPSRGRQARFFNESHHTPLQGLYFLFRTETRILIHHVYKTRLESSHIVIIVFCNVNFRVLMMRLIACNCICGRLKFFLESCANTGFELPYHRFILATQPPSS